MALCRLCWGVHAAFDGQVSHRMLSALEAAYGWPGESQLTVVKDLNSGDPVAFPCRLESSNRVTFDPAIREPCAAEVRSTGLCKRCSRN